MEDPSIRVLIIDDEQDLLDIAKQFLEFDRTISVDTSLSAADAIMLLGRREYGVIVSDYQMPNKDGIQLLKEIRGTGNKIPFILFTGKGREEVAIEALNNGANFYLQKGGQSASQFAELVNMIKQAYFSKLGERALRISEDRYRSLFENNIDAVMLTTEDFESILSANPSACKLFGMTEDEIRATGIKGLITDNKTWESVVRRLNETGIIKGEFTYRRKDGTIFTGETTHGILTGHYGIARISMIVRDVTERKRTEKALNESQNMLLNILDASPSLIYLYDLKEHRNLYINREVADFLGYSPQQMLEMGASLFENILHPDDKKWVEEYQEGLRHSANGTISDTEYRMRKPDGSWRWLHSRDVVFERDPDGSVRIELGIAWDVTERKRAEEALQQSERKYRVLVESANIAILVVQDGMIKLANPNLLALSGYSKQELLSEPYATFIYPEDRTLAIERLQKRMAGENVSSTNTVRLNKKDGSIAWVDVDTVIIDWEGRPGGLNFLIDITEKKRALESLQNIKEKYESLLNQMIDCIYISDLEGNNMSANAALLALLGYTKEEMSSLNFFSMLDPEQVPMMLENVAYIEKVESQKRLFEIRLRRKNGGYVDLEASASIVYRKGIPYAIQGVARDVTNSKRAERAIQDANRKLNLLSSITRHDINNQLMALDGNLTLLSVKELDPASKELLRKSNSAMNRISVMIQFTKEYEDVGVKAPIWQNIRSLIEKEVKSVTLGSIKLANDIPSDIEIYADPLVSKVFHNLIDNAVKHGGNVTTMHFFTEEVDGVRRIVCEDNGNGISADMKDALFIHDSKDDHGFGLFLSREILAITGITIQENGKPGKGARFEMTVPAEAWRSR